MRNRIFIAIFTLAYSVALCGLSSSLLFTTAAASFQGQEEIKLDLRDALKNKRLVEGLNLVHTLPTGEKISVRVRGGKVVEWVLTDEEGKLHKGTLKEEKENTGIAQRSKGAVVSETVFCSMNFITVIKDSKTGKLVTRKRFVKIPCPDSGDKGGLIDPFKDDKADPKLNPKPKPKP